MKSSIGIIVSSLFVLAWGGGGARAADLEVLFPAPAFRLTDQDGRTVTNEDLRGKTWVIDFIFTRCPGPCPLMTQKMVGLSKIVSSPDVRFVSVSVDPAFDTPAVLKRYAEARGATDPRFIFLTGDRKAIYDMAQKGFKLVARQQAARSPILHDERFLLVDGSGDVRGVYRSRDDASMAQLAVDVAAVASGVAPAPAANDAGGDDPPPGMTTARAGRTAPTTSRERWIRAFPALNASLNASAGIFLCFGMIMIKAGKTRAHAACMIAAVLMSVAFLACYLTYHAMLGGKVTRFPASAWKPLYLGILVSHTILAVVILPMIAMTLARAWRRRWAGHRRIAAPTFWLWLYVSATGVVVYWMLYHLAPRVAAGA